MLWFRVPPKIYFKRGATDVALRELEGKKRAFIVTDRYLFDSGMVNAITNVLEDMDIEYQIFIETIWGILIKCRNWCCSPLLLENPLWKPFFVNYEKLKVNVVLNQ